MNEPVVMPNASLVFPIKLDTPPTASFQRRVIHHGSLFFCAAAVAAAAGASGPAAGASGVCASFHQSWTTSQPSSSLSFVQCAPLSTLPRAICQ